jgi:hypothetical protein
MLRPSNSLLGSSRATRRANLRAERIKALGVFARAVRKKTGRLVRGLFELVLLVGLPLLYLSASYLAIDLPARWMQGREHPHTTSLLLFAGAAVVGLVGLVRAVQGVPPVAPVRPRFARWMYGLSWVAGLLFVLGDLAGPL